MKKIQDGYRLLLIFTVLVLCMLAISFPVAYLTLTDKSEFLDVVILVLIPCMAYALFGLIFCSRIVYVEAYSISYKAFVFSKKRCIAIENIGKIKLQYYQYTHVKIVTQNDETILVGHSKKLIETLVDMFPKDLFEVDYYGFSYKKIPKKHRILLKEKGILSKEQLKEIYV